MGIIVPAVWKKFYREGVTFVTGTYAPERNFGFVITDGKFLPDVYVPQEDAMGARRGDKVKVRITKYPDEVSGLRGEVTEIFGAAGDSGQRQKRLSPAMT